jgi:hypothetical protein
VGGEMEKDLYVIRGGRGSCEETVETVVVLFVKIRRGG